MEDMVLKAEVAAVVEKVDLKDRVEVGLVEVDMVVGVVADKVI